MGQMTDVLTYHNDNARTGQMLNEQILTPANVNSTHFGKLRVLPADGQVYAQPLYAAGVSIPSNGIHNVLIVATENDTVYAYDADSGASLWQASMLGAGEQPSDTRGCTEITPTIGITATPVIDRRLGPNGTIFVAAMSALVSTGTTYIQRIHALDLGTGADRVSPVVVSATYPGTGDNSSGGIVKFDPAQYKERPGLLLLNGVVYTAWSSHCDHRPYTGWIIGYNESTLAQVTVFNITPNGSEGSLWMAGNGIATDGTGAMYMLVANGTLDPTFDANGFPASHDFGNCFLKLSVSGTTLVPVDYFATYNTPYENEKDLDFGSGGALVLPDMVTSSGSTVHLAVGAGKDTNLYLVNRDNMGKFNASNDNAIYQELDGVLTKGVWSSPAYFNGAIYYGAVGNPMREFTFQNAILSSTSVSQSAYIFSYPGATPSISASGTANGIVWAIANSGTASLRAYDAGNLGNALYDSNLVANGRDYFGAGNKFATPTIASARVYAGFSSGVAVFGLLDQSTLTPIQIWRDNNFGNPSNIGAGADTYCAAPDGVSNLIKYALGLPPRTPAQPGQLPVASMTVINGTNYLTLTVNRLAEPTDVTYTVEVSGDLSTWSSGTGVTTTITNSSTKLVVRDDTPFTRNNRRFIHLKVREGE